MPDWNCKQNKLCSRCVDRIEQINDLFNESHITPNEYKECVGEALLEVAPFANKCDDFDCKHFLDFIFYSDVAVKSSSEDIFSIKNMIQSYRNGKILDDILECTPHSVLDEELFTKIQLDCSCYIDHNFLIDFSKECRFIIPEELSESCKFVFSIVHISETLKSSNKNALTENIEKIKELTHGIMMRVSSQQWNYFSFYDVNDNYDSLIKFANSHVDVDLAIERKRYYAKQDLFVFDELFESKDIAATVNNYSDLFSSVSKEKLISFLNCRGVITEDSFCKSVLSMGYAELRCLVYALYGAMDIFNYHRDKTKLSGSQDIEHLIYGLGCDYFLTSDKKLYNRAIQLYKYLNVPTKCVYAYPPNSRHWKAKEKANSN